MKGLNGHDKSASTDIAIGIKEGKVVIHWHQPTNHISFDPQNAFDFGEQMARTAHKARFGEEAPNDGSYLASQIRQRITEDLRDRMVVRATHVIRSQEAKGKTPADVARSVVDTILAEVS
jgi:hypothetical protein